MKVVIATPTIKEPHPAYLEALEASVPALEEAGFEHASVFEIGNPYISAARAAMIRKALDAKADVIVCIDHDVSWRPADLVKLIRTEAEVAAGTYRFKKPEIHYMGTLVDGPGMRPVVRADGCIKAELVPAGFLKLTTKAIDRVMAAYPELLYGPRYAPLVDLFHHGAHEGVWWGEDFAFSRRWRELDDLWIVPDLDLDHHSETEAFPGNFHRFLMESPKSQ